MKINPFKTIHLKIPTVYLKVNFKIPIVNVWFDKIPNVLPFCFSP